MEKLEWLKQRQEGIGGSDAGAIMGVNNWKGAFEVYIEKTEELTELTEITEVSEAGYWGTTLEEIVAKEFAIRTGKRVRRDNKHIVHKDYPFMVANIDRRVVGENAILECTTANRFLAKEWENDEIPPSYLVQCQHYLEVTGADICYIAVLIGGQKFVFKEIQRDEEIIAMIIEEEKDFWNNCVLKRVPPLLDNSQSANRYLKDKFGLADSSLDVNLKSDNKDRIIKYLGLKKQHKELEESIKIIENNIKNELGTAERGSIENFLVNWKSIISNRIDSKVLKSKYPEVYKEVCKQSVSRRFEIKGCAL